MSTPDHPPALITYRGDWVENSHIAHVAVVDADPGSPGRLLYSFGDPHRMTLARSAAKPAQALSVIETGALERFGLDDADLALMCASHSSEDRHVARALAMLAKSGANEADLHCGGHAPLSDAVHRAWIKRDYSPTAVCSNCSGKHAGMLAGAQALGAGRKDYHLPEHPMQQQVKRVTADACGLQESEVGWGIDGCNLPTPAFPLDRLARLFGSLADSADRVGRASDSPVSGAHAPQPPRTQALARIYHAMTGYPELVAGDGRFCTALMQAFDGQVVGKVGADACYGLGLRASDATRRLGAQGAIGLSIKVEDGNAPVLYMLVCELLEQLQIGTPQQRQRLAAFHRPAMVNTRQVTTGRVEFRVGLRAAMRQEG